MGRMATMMRVLVAAAVASVSALPLGSRSLLGSRDIECRTDPSRPGKQLVVNNTADAMAKVLAFSNFSRPGGAEGVINCYDLPPHTVARLKVDAELSLDPWLLFAWKLPLFPATVELYPNATGFPSQVMLRPSIWPWPMEEQETDVLEGPFSSHTITEDGQHCYMLSVTNNTDCFNQFWEAHHKQYQGWSSGKCPSRYNLVNKQERVCDDGSVVTECKGIH